ncbi:hypothetical protein [Thioalkalivibrio sp. ALR17-21]|uniref:hypothetical protein n=1 Tax=Thioalkalivibrio sp. ALR17-21 TaxID=1269813 RepID=UPI0004626709|nr:hypothetical protein [Thioalkalivibrio sp. ALR17-21]
MTSGYADQCSCRRMRAHQPSTLCADQYTFAENGKQVRYAPRQQEETRAIVLDGCVFNDNEMRCDGLFLWWEVRGGRKVAALVELKGAGDISHGFEQLAHVRSQRPEYQEMVSSLNKEAPGRRAFERAVIVTSGQMTKPERVRLETQYGIRVRVITHSVPTRPVPDLRDEF